MSSASRQCFGDFVLDAANRSLVRDGAPVALNARYFDALTLLVREHGKLVVKQRFFDEVWTGSVVTDAALTQCVKEIRRQLGDDAGNPRFVRTIPGHGYCFIAAVRDADSAAELAAPAAQAPAGATLAQELLADGAAAAVGGAAAGLLGGLLYGSALAFAPQAQGLGSLSVLLVLLALNISVGMTGALGVGLGLAVGRRLGRGAGWMLAGAALGGFAVGGLVKMLGSDTLRLLVGHAPSGTTGGLEGAVLGFAVAAGLLLGGGLDAPQGRRPVMFAALAGGLSGALLTLLGGGLMATSLARASSAFDRSQLDMAPLGRLFGQAQLGDWAQAALGALEGGLFGACFVAALLLARRQHGPMAGTLLQLGR